MKLSIGCFSIEIEGDTLRFLALLALLALIAIVPLAGMAIQA